MSRILAILLGVLLVVLIIYVGVRLRGGSFGTGEPQLNVNLQEIIPEGWTATTDNLIRINIDGDIEKEWLLLYNYDDAQIGGVIYDAQNRPRGEESVPIPEQTSAYLVPYRLLPDYYVPKTTGYLGNTKVDYKMVNRNSDANDANKQFLEVRGFLKDQINRFSLFWWIDEQTGYGGAYASTPGWFSLSGEKPHDWSRWDEGAPFIDEVWAWEPQTDRANLCRRAIWRLHGEDSESQTKKRFVAFYDGDIVFCSGDVPKDPAFPEAQVLAFLKDGVKQRWLDPTDTNLPAFANATVKSISAPVVLDERDMETTDEGQGKTVEVKVDFTVDDVEYNQTWSVVMIRPQSIKDAVQWRIVSIAEN